MVVSMKNVFNLHIPDQLLLVSKKQVQVGISPTLSWIIMNNLSCEIVIFTSLLVLVLLPEDVRIVEFSKELHSVNTGFSPIG